jgi:hypothetical protein
MFDEAQRKKTEIPGPQAVVSKQILSQMSECPKSPTYNHLVAITIQTAGPGPASRVVSVMMVVLSVMATGIAAGIKSSAILTFLNLFLLVGFVLMLEGIGSNRSNYCAGK